jgi:hypothetical protein
VPQDVEDAVDHQPHQFLANRHRLRARVLQRLRGAHVHVPCEPRGVLESESDDVGHAVVPEGSVIQRSHLVGIEERDGQRRLARRLRIEHCRGPPGHLVRVERKRAVEIGDTDVMHRTALPNRN